MRVRLIPTAMQDSRWFLGQSRFITASLWRWVSAWFLLRPRTIVSLLMALFAGALWCAMPARALTLNEVGAGELLFRIDEEEQWDPAVQLGTKVEIRVTGLVARVSVEQRFRNSQPDWAEARYVFPLPETAAVNEMTVRIDDRLIVGEIHEKKKARAIHEQAKKEGKRTALVEQQRPNLFSTSVANIGPGQEVQVQLVYLERVAYTHGQFSLRLPLTITPRYIPGQPEPHLPPPNTQYISRTPQTPAPNVFGWAQPTDEVPDADQVTPFHRPEATTRAVTINPVEITASVDPGLPLATLASTYHEITINRQDTGYQVRLADGFVSMDRDFELTWQPVPSASPQAAVFTEVVDGETYALAMVMPPQEKGKGPELKREVVFIIDVSGSMSGESIVQARAALHMAMGTLKRKDRFNIIKFSNDATTLFSTAQLADGAYLQDAKRFIDRLEADGGTEMLPAIQAALRNQPIMARDEMRQVIFITDGAVGNEDKLFQFIHDHLGESRLFTVGIGSAPNSYFMRKAAQFGRGSFTYIGQQSEVQTKMAELFTQLEGPQLRDVAVNWPGVADTYPVTVPDLYSGQPLVITAKLRGPGGSLSIAGNSAERSWSQSLPLPDQGGAPLNYVTGIATLWAREQLGALNDIIIRQGESEPLRRLMIDVALTHRLVSRYTSFVAVDRTPVRPAGEALGKRSVPNALPQGSTILGYPQTATPAVEKFLFGIVSLMLAFQIWWLRRRDLKRAGFHA